MDFGLDKLVEMIEVRFGRFAGTVVLAAVGIAALAFAIHAVFSYLIMPVVRAAPDLLGALGIAWRHMTAEELVSVIAQIILGLLSAGVAAGVYVLLTRRIHKSMKRTMIDARTTIDECRAYTEKNHSELEAHLVEADKILEQVKAEADEIIRHATETANKMIKAAEEKAGLPKSEPLSLQSLRDTGENKQP